MSKVEKTKTRCVKFENIRPKSNPYTFHYDSILFSEYFTPKKQKSYSRFLKNKDIIE